MHHARHPRRAVLMGLLASFALLCVAAPVAQAQSPAAELSRSDEKNIRAVVQSQLDAFAADDSKKAFSFATPGIQKVMVNAERFMALVQASYPMVYRPAAVAFLKPEQSAGEVVQRVQLTDARGTPWLALYSMEQQKDKSWRIGGCVVVPETRQSA
ncbi:MAG: DUF4864 domain-containing protein [Burkholderiaceae bacterium]